MSQARVLIIDDEPDIRELLEMTLQQMALAVDSVATVAEARKALAPGKYQLCLTDMKLPDGDGLGVIEHIQTHTPDTPVAMITAFGSMDTAIAALKTGAFDFVNKPLELDRLRKLVDQALHLQDTRPVNADAASRLTGHSAAIKHLRERIQQVARSQAPVYISGESGSGKELVARLIHANSARGSGPFVPVNCGAIPAELMESEFFGHRKGSFTGAHTDKQGLFQAADGGTLFLDEVADLPMAMQVKLLRAIQEKAVRPVGGQQEVAVDTRILSATHKPLATEVAEGRFRSDLFYRINVIELQVPSLRERTEDIPLLADAILTKLASGTNSPPARLSEEALDQLKAYPFPGNVRELENALERAWTLSHDPMIEAKDLLLRDSPLTRSTAAPETDTTLPDGPVHDLDGYLAEIEKTLITRALEANRWNRTATAEQLGISFRQLRYRIKKLGID